MGHSRRTRRRRGRSRGRRNVTKVFRVEGFVNEEVPVGFRDLLVVCDSVRMESGFFLGGRVLVIYL